MRTEPIHNAEFLLSEGEGVISRDAVTLAKGQNLVAGTVLGKITASGKYAAYNNAATDGTETAAGILLMSTDATNADMPAVAITRLAEVTAQSLTGLDTAATADLAALNIIVR